MNMLEQKVSAILVRFYRKIRKLVLIKNMVIKKIILIITTPI